MPRRRQRFSDLERQLKRLNGATPAAGSDLDNYLKWKSGAAGHKTTISKKLTADEKKRYGIGLIPFSLSPQSSGVIRRYQASVTAYSNTIRTELTISQNSLGWGDADDITDFDEFYPAVLRVFVPSGTANTTPISSVTKKEYTRRAGKSGSFPFGRTITNVKDAKTGAVDSTLDTVDQEDVRKSLAEAIKTAKPSASISFEPELFRPAKAPLPTLPA